ncbi:ASCH domain-containing protein [Flindersiella endophytica]
MLLEQRARDGILAGTITVLFRRWRSPQVVAGRRYRTTAGLLDVESAAVVQPGDISPADAELAGYPSVADLLANLRGDSAAPLYRVAVRPAPADASDPRDVLARKSRLSAGGRAELDKRLARLEAGRSPWVEETLRIIADHPGVSARELAERLGRERDAFKLDVRKLKALGLTLSLEVGYRLSPRGRAYLRGKA